MENLITGKIAIVYGIKLDINSNLVEEIRKIEAEHKADVHITIDGITKEFTFDEFKKLLGF